MIRQFNFKSVCIAFCVCIFLVLAVNRHIINKVYLPHPKTINITFQNYSKTEAQNYEDAILEMTRTMIKIETWSYNFNHSGVDKLSDLVMERDGTPIRSIIVSTWRSGSSFLGDLINAVPGSFYSYEPLMMFGLFKQIKGPPHAAKATKLLKKILRCNFNNGTDLVKYFKFAKNNLKSVNQFRHNKRFNDKCNHKKELCFDADFTTKFCKLFPFQAMKLDRLRLPLVRDILDDGGLNVKVVLLVRDPRGVMQSRRHIKNFCSNKNVPDCADVRLVCSDMVTDYEAAVEFLHKYPDRLMVLRYEDLAFNLEETTLQLMKFLRVEFAHSVHEFLETHTTVSNSEKFSTFRVTESIPLKWKNIMKFGDVKEIQEKCKKAMSLWGYEPAHNASHMKSNRFNPLSTYTVKETV